MKELVEKIKSDLIKANIIRFQADADNASSVIEQSISEHFTPDGELVETITDGYMTISKKCPNCGKMTMQFVRPGKVQCSESCESKHLQESGSGLDLGVTPSRLWRLEQKYNCDDFVQILNEIGSKANPIDDKGIAERAKAFYECNACKYVTQPSGTWDMLADFAISELSRLPQGKEDAEKSWEENKVQPNQVEKSLELLEKYLKETPKEEIEALLESIPYDPNGITIEDYFARFGCDCEQGEWISVKDRLPDSYEIRMKAIENDEKDFDQWWWETVYKGN